METSPQSNRPHLRLAWSHPGFIQPPLPMPQVEVCCLAARCPFRATAIDKDRALAKLEAHLSSFHPEYLGPDRAA